MNVVQSFFEAENVMKTVMSKKYVMFIVFVSLSAAGSFLKIPSPIGSVAFDSMPALVGSALLSPVFGLLVAFLGHLLSAFLAGFPLGPIHILIAGCMGGLVLLFGLIYRFNRKKTSLFTFVAGNGLFAPLIFYPFLGKMVVMALIPSLCVAAVLNVTAATILIPRMKSTLRKTVIRMKP